MAEGRGSPVLGGLRLISLGLRLTTSLPRKTPRLRSWRRVHSAGPSRPPRRGPNLSSSIRGPRAARACAPAPPRRPRPPPARTRRCPAPLRGGHVDSGRAGRGRRSPKTPCPPPWHLPAVVTPEEFPLALRAPQVPSLPSVSPSVLLWQSWRSRPGCIPQTSTEFPMCVCGGGSRSWESPRGLFAEARAALSLL